MLSATDYMRQASMTSAEYMDRGIDYIDAAFGEGYAKEHPELLGAFINAAAQDFHTAMLNDATFAIANNLKEIAREIDHTRKAYVAIADSINSLNAGLYDCAEVIAEAITPSKKDD